VQEVVARPLLAAKTEAASARKGVGLVKVRQEGWGGIGSPRGALGSALWVG
jgi:hypothetical protein